MRLFHDLKNQPIEGWNAFWILMAVIFGGYPLVLAFLWGIAWYSILAFEFIFGEISEYTKLGICIYWTGCSSMILGFWFNRVNPAYVRRGVGE